MGKLDLNRGGSIDNRKERQLGSQHQQHQHQFQKQNICELYPQRHSWRRRERGKVEGGRKRGEYGEPASGGRGLTSKTFDGKQPP